MENEFLNKVEDNAAVRAWSEKLESEKGDSLVEGYTSELPKFTPINLTCSRLRWKNVCSESWLRFGTLLTIVSLLESGFGAYMEEYTTLLRCPKVQVRKAYIKVFNGPTFAKKLMAISGMSESWVTARIQQKGDSKCIPWENLIELVLTHPDERKRIDIFALSIYGLMIFPKALRYVDEAVTDLFDHLEKGITPVPAILAETFRSLSICRKTGEGRFIRCAQLLMVWFHGHF
ncbi:hypothetical protein CXB51_022928 [Gossypium anomalum]|uniref:DUF7745 domain-containing protein n=1 Tax=Gossypium anomalum TaxID=47600 RepID=A0A8J6CTN6_9ROSI|nr:hypothetical protein CXB51_022928 [Gossypium anomalum]